MTRRLGAARFRFDVCHTQGAKTAKQGVSAQLYSVSQDEASAGSSVAKSSRVPTHVGLQKSNGIDALCAERTALPVLLLFVAHTYLFLAALSSTEVTPSWTIMTPSLRAPSYMYPSLEGLYPPPSSLAARENKSIIDIANFPFRNSTKSRDVPPSDPSL